MADEINYKFISPLKFYTQHILPLVYDDSLSYLEMLGKVKNKLNELIDYYNSIKDLVPNALKGEIEKIQAQIAEEMETAIGQLNDQLTADIGDLNSAKTDALDDIDAATLTAKAAVTAFATTEVQRIISEYDGALAPLLNPSATAVPLPAGSAPTATYNNGVFTFGLPGTAGDMTVAVYGGSTAGVVAKADDSNALGGVGASGYMTKAVYDTNNNGKVDVAENAETANDADALGGVAASGYMTKAVYDANNDGKVDTAESAELADNSEMLGGKLPAYYATAAGLTSALDRIAALENTGLQVFEYANIEDPINEGAYWVIRKYGNAENGYRFEAWLEFEITIDTTNGLAYNPVFVSPLTTIAKFPDPSVSIDQQFISASSTLNNVFCWNVYAGNMNNEQDKALKVRVADIGYQMTFTCHFNIYLVGFIPPVPAEP